MNWPAVQKKDPIYLNLGGGINCHPKIGYENYISVDINSSHEGWSVKHDLREPIPLPEHSVTRILSEDLMEHLKTEEIKLLLKECFRLLKSRTMIRIGVPDYDNPKDRPYFEKGRDPRQPDHITLTNYKLMKNIIEESPFSCYEFYHYWDEGKFVYKKIDYSFGMIKRTPDNDPKWRLDLELKMSEEEMFMRRGNLLYVTSVVVDLFKD